MKHRASQIGTVLDSPLAYYSRVTEPFEQTPARRFGSLVDAHLFAYELDRWHTYEAAKRGKGWGDRDVTNDEWHEAIACANTIRKHPRAAEVLSAGEAQFQMEWQEEGLTVSGRPDFLSTAMGLVIDLKTTSGGLSDWALGTTVAKWRYHIQMGAYLLGLRANGIDLAPAFLFVQSAPPYDCRIVQLTEEQAALSVREAQRCLRKIARCEAEGRWPGVSDQIDTLILPPHAFGPEIEP